MLRTLLRWLLRIVAGLMLMIVVGLAAYAGYATWAWADIPVATLSERYGDDALQVATIDGLPIRYRLQGPPGRPVVALIHSHFLDMGMWDDWVDVLTPTYRVLRYDLAGHGLTGPDPSGRYGVDRDVELLRGLLDQLGIAHAHVVGSSLGGNIAFSFAARHPDRTDALVLVNSGGLKRKNSRGGGEIPAWADQVLPLIPPGALHRFLLWMAADDTAITAAVKTRFVDMFRRTGNRAAELERLRQFDTGDPEPLLAQVRSPTLILWGVDNPQLPVALADRFAGHLTRARQVAIRRYPGAGHLLPLERPQASARDTVDFLHHAAHKPAT